MGLKDYFKANRQRALLVLLLVTLTQAATTIYTYLTTPELNAIAQGKFSFFLELILVQFLIGQVCNISFNLGSVQNTKQTQALFHQVRQKMIRHFYQKPAKVSEMENHLGNDLQLIQENYYNIYFYFVCDLIYIILIIGTLFTFHWILVAYTLTITALAIIVPKLMENYTNPATEAVSLQNKRFLQVLEKWFAGLEELRRYQNKLVLKKVVGSQSRQLEDSEYRRDKLMCYTGMVAAVFNIAGRVGVPLIAGILYFKGQVNLGAILTAGYFANGIFYSVDSCVNKYTQLKSTKTLRNNLANLQKNLPEDNYDSAADIASIQVKNLVVKYPHGEKITYPDFILKKGEKVLLTGDSGTGKSTLFKVLLRQIKPVSGAVIYRNRTGEAIQPDLRYLGYLAQDLRLFPGSIRENVTMFKPKLNEKVVSLVDQMAFTADQARLKDGIKTQLEMEQNLLSGGQKQKVVLMRALLHNTPVLYLDEATSAIDQVGTTTILQNLVQTQAIVLAIAHNLTPKQKALFDREIHLEEK